MNYTFLCLRFGLDPTRDIRTGSRNHIWPPWKVKLWGWWHLDSVTETTVILRLIILKFKLKIKHKEISQIKMLRLNLKRQDFFYLKWQYAGKTFYVSVGTGLPELKRISLRYPISSCTFFYCRITLYTRHTCYSLFCVVQFAT